MKQIGAYGFSVGLDDTLAGKEAKRCFGKGGFVV